MKAKELAKELMKHPERIVVNQTDSEGNGYYEVSGIWKGLFDSGEGEVGIEKLTNELRKEGYGKEDIPENGKPAIILY